MSLLNLEYNYKKGTNEFSFSLKVMSTVNRRNGRNRDALLAAGGAAAAGVGTAIGNAALRNIQHNAQAAGTSLLNSISNVFRAEDFRSHPDSTGTGSHDSVQNSQAAQPSYEAPTSSKRPRVEQAEPDSTATDSELMSRAGSGGGSSGGGGAMQAVGGDPFIARPLSHTYQKMSFYFSKRHYFRISTFLPKVYYGTNSEVSPNNFLLDPTYVFDFSSPVWYLNEQEYNQLWGAMQVYTVQAKHYAAKVRLVGQQAPFISNVESQLPANPNLPSTIEVGSNIEASIPVGMAEVDIASGGGPLLSKITPFARNSYGQRLHNKFMVPTLGQPGPYSGGGGPVTLTSTMTERLYDIAATFPILNTDSLQFQVPQFNRCLTVYDGAKMSGDLLNVYCEPEECYLSTQETFRNSDVTMNGVFLPTSIGNKEMTTGQPKSTDIQLSNSHISVSNPKDIVDVFRMQSYTADKLTWGRSERPTYEQPMSYIRVNTPYALDNSTPSELLLKLVVDVDCSFEAYFIDGMLQGNFLPQQCRDYIHPKYLRKQPFTEAASFNGFMVNNALSNPQ